MTFLGLRPPPEAPRRSGEGGEFVLGTRTPLKRKKNFDRGLKFPIFCVDVSPPPIVDERPVDERHPSPPKYYVRVKKIVKMALTKSLKVNK